MKKNNAQQMETIQIYLEPEKHPIAFAAKVAELVENGMDEEEARIDVMRHPIEVEMYYEKYNGLFLVESEAVECVPIYSPYTKEQLEEFDED